MVEFFVNLHYERHFSSCWSWIPCAARVFMASNTLQRQFMESSWPQLRATLGRFRWDPTIIDLLWWWLLCNQIPSRNYVKPSPSLLGRWHRWSRKSTKVLFTICIVWDYIEQSCSMPKSPKCNSSLPTSLISILWLVSLHVSLLQFHVHSCIPSYLCFGWEWVWCISTFSIVTDPGFSNLWYELCFLVQTRDLM
jgi:hypothetical protein